MEEIKDEEELDPALKDLSLTQDLDLQSSFIQDDDGEVRLQYPPKRVDGSFIRVEDESEEPSVEGSSKQLIEH